MQDGQKLKKALCIHMEDKHKYIQCHSIHCTSINSSNLDTVLIKTCTLFWVDCPKRLGVDVVAPNPEKPDVPVDVEAPNRVLLCPNKLVFCCCVACGCCPNKEVPVEAGVGLNAER